MMTTGKETQSAGDSPSPEVNRQTDAAIEVLRSGALDLSPGLLYTAVMRIDRRRGTDSKWDLLEQAASNVMQEREGHGSMIWEIPIVKFGEEYARLVKESEEQCLQT